MKFQLYEIVYLQRLNLFYYEFNRNGVTKTKKYTNGRTKN